jgi:hypothetical protein
MREIPRKAQKRLHGSMPFAMTRSLEFPKTRDVHHRPLDFPRPGQWPIHCCTSVQAFPITHVPGGSMFLASLILFLLAACGGVGLFTLRLRNRPLPGWLGAAHGIVAASGLALLGYGVIHGGYGGNKPQIALTLLIIAALGGFGLAYLNHGIKRPLPIPLILVHAAIAVAGVITLLWHLLAATSPP